MKRKAEPQGIIGAEPLGMDWHRNAVHLHKTKEEIRLDVFFCFVEIVGVEPTTLCLQSRCSSQLSYTPKISKNL